MNHWLKTLLTNIAGVVTLGVATQVDQAISASPSGGFATTLQHDPALMAAYVVGVTFAHNYLGQLAARAGAGQGQGVAPKA